MDSAKGTYWVNHVPCPIKLLRLVEGELEIVADAAGKPLPGVEEPFHFRLADPLGQTVMEVDGQTFSHIGALVTPDTQEIRQRVRLTNPKLVL